jgi:putative chitinase
MSYLDTLSAQQKDNIAIIIDEAKKAGITNPNTIAGMLAIVSKESGFVPKEEKTYAGTSNERIRKVFGGKIGHLSDSELNSLKADPKRFFDTVYGGRYDNAADEGYKFRGRGFNQLTFKGNYKKYGDAIGENLVANPNKVNNVRTAAKVLIAYNKAGIDSLAKKGKLKEYNATNINDFKNTKDATLAFYPATAGTGKDVSYVKGLAKSDHLGGMTRALNRVNDLLGAVGTYVKKNPLKVIGITALVVVATWVLIKYSGIGKKNKIIKTITN